MHRGVCFAYESMCMELHCLRVMNSFHNSTYMGTFGVCFTLVSFFESKKSFEMNGYLKVSYVDPKVNPILTGLYGSTRPTTGTYSGV